MYRAPEVFYDVPEKLKQACQERLPEGMIDILDHFDEGRKARGSMPANVPGTILDMKPA